jgi:outer membrane protein assembly factor BamE (lipoprotein component of BamABCDE complex)
MKQLISLKKIKRLFISLSCFTLFTIPLTGFATTYCAFGGSYIRVGMSLEEIKQACGTPLSTKTKKTYNTRNVAVSQLYYTFRNTQQRSNAFAYAPKIANEVKLMVSIKANKVIEISLNSNATQGASVCPNGAIQIGSSISAVTRACGSPGYVNQSFKSIRQSERVEKETWILKASPYDPPITLTFSDGVLQSIQN